jgi:sensor histidine kinase YesM
MSAATTSTSEPLRATAGRVIVALWLAAILYVIALSTVITRGFGGKAVFAEPVVEQVIFLLLWGIATPAIIWSADRWPINRQRWRHRVLLHLSIATAFIVSLNIVGPMLAWLILGRPSTFGVVLRQGVLGLISAFHLALIVYAFILGAGHYLRTLDIRRSEQLRAERLRADLASAQLRALTLQLQPHFLFNALNAVGALIITERNREAFEVVGRLGELLRALLAIEHRDEVSLREELELVEAYVSIEQARLGERLRVTWNVGPDLASAQVPPMLLQPLVENAIRHGIARSSNGGSVVIDATKAGTRLALVVADDGPDMPNAPARDTTERAGVGLENTRQRLAHLYGDDQRLDLSRDAGWTCVRVELPFHVLANATPTASEGAAA